MNLNTSPAPKVKKKKVLGGLDIFLGLVCLMLFLDTIAPTAAMGPSSILWYLIIAALFFVPTALITAELGATYPDEGGLYSWVKRGLGRRWAARVSWYYWCNNAVWVSSAAIFVVQVFAQLFMPGLSFTAMVVASVALIWLYVFIATRALKDAKWVTNIGAIFKLAIVLGMLICAGIFLAKNGGQPANDLSLKQFTPVLGASFFFFPAIIYNLMGFESICSMGSQMKNPAKDLPRAIIITVFLITAVYILSVLAILVIMPYEDMNVVEGIMNCFIYALSGDGISGVIITIIGIMFIYTLVAQGPVWMTSASIMASEASQNNELPAIFGKMHKKHQSPLGGLVLIGIVSTVLTVIYGFMASTAEDLFWTLFSFTSIIFFLPYIVDFSAFVRLRKNDPEAIRPYRFPGPQALAFFFCRLGQFILFFTIMSFFWVPGQPVDWAYTIPLIIGVGTALIIGEILNHRSLKKAEPSQ